MNGLLLRNRSVLKAGSKKVTKHTGKGLPVIEMLEDRVTPATALFDSVSGILSLDLAGAESSFDFTAFVDEVAARSATILRHLMPVL